MSQIIYAIYEEGILKPIEPLNLKEHTRIQIQISPVLERSEGMEEDIRQQADEILALARESCAGLSEEELAIMESAKINGTNFFSNLSKF